MHMDIEINGRKITLKFSFRAEMLFEQINDRSFTAANTTEWIQLFFCYVICATSDGEIKFDDFIGWIDENPDKFYDFITWYTDKMQNISDLRASKKEEGKGTARKRANR